MALWRHAGVTSPRGVSWRGDARPEAGDKVGGSQRARYEHLDLLRALCPKNDPFGCSIGRRPIRIIRSSILRCFVVVVGLLGGVALQTGQAEATPSLWSITPSPDQGAVTNILDAVSCTDPTWCVAVGYDADVNVTPSQTLIESWDGTGWSIIPSPDQGTDASYLNGVSCTSSTFCVAVGGSLGTVQTTLVEFWDGTAWSIVPSPDQGSSNNLLTGVSCTDPTNCVAVGYDGSVDQTLVESWDGTAWAIIPSPDQGTSTNDLYAVSCTSTTFCMAVGFYRTYRTLIETWDGSAWTVSSSPTPSVGRNSVLNSVSCTSSTACVAVGYHQRYRTLIETWDGSAWTITLAPHQGNSRIVDGASCSLPTDCVAVGQHVNGSGSSQTSKTLIKSGNSGAWSGTRSPDPDSDFSDLIGVSCVSTTDCVAVGYYTDPSTGTYQTLIESGTT
jgi:hypothetical protein